MHIQHWKKGLVGLTMLALLFVMSSCGSKDEDGGTEGKSGGAVQSVSVGERVTMDFIDLTIEQAGTAESIRPSDPDPTSYYVISKKPNNNEVFFCLTGLARNTGGDEYNLGQTFVRMIFDDKYRYAGSVCGDTGDSIMAGEMIKPLGSIRYYFYASVPKETIETFSTVTVQFAFNDQFKAGRGADFSDYGHCYEIRLNRDQAAAPIEIQEVGPSFTAIGIGDRIVKDFVEMTIEEAVTADSIRPSDPHGSYRYLPAKEGEQYIFVKGNVKNTGPEGYNLDNTVAKIAVDDHEPYYAFIILDSGDNLETLDKYLGSGKSSGYYLYASIPENTLSPSSVCRIQFGFHDGFASTGFISNFKAYENCYEIVVNGADFRQGTN